MLADVLARRLVFVTGKGGVGKTAVALALAVAASRARRRVLLVEINPYGRIGEYLGGHTLGPEPVEVMPNLSAAAIVTYTTSGSTTLRAARERPEVPVLCLTERIETARRLALCWGTHCVQTKDVSSFSEMVEKACSIAREQGIAEKGQRLVVTAGVPFGTPGSTNVLRIAWVEE